MCEECLKEHRDCLGAFKHSIINGLGILADCLKVYYLGGVRVCDVIRFRSAFAIGKL